MNSDKSLKDWADKQSPFIRLTDGEVFVGKYVGWEEVPNRFDPKKKIIKYSFVNDDGEEKSFENGSTNTAYQFHDVLEGSRVELMRIGEGQKTKYYVKEVVDKEGKISKKTADDINEVMGG